MNNIELRKNNKKNNIIKVIREEENVSRYVLQKKTKYSMTTILNAVSSLVKDNLITEEESTHKGVGRTPIYLDINPQGRLFIGIEFNAERIKAVILNFLVEVEYSKRYKIPEHANSDQVIKLLKIVIEEILGHISDFSKVEGVGIGLPGYVDKDKGIALQYSYFDKWDNIHIQKIIEEEFKVHVHIDNNINALAYNYRYEHDEKSHFAIVSMQYGVRLGIVIDHEIFRGSSGNAGEIGHTKVNNGLRQCTCGKIGCLDSEISYIAIEQKVKEYIKDGKLLEIGQMIQSQGKFRMEMLARFIKRNNEDAIHLLEDITRHLGSKLMTVVSVLDVEDIIILNVSDIDNSRFARMVSDQIKSDSLEILTKNLHVHSEVVDSFGGAKGAAIMILEEKFGYIREM